MELDRLSNEAKRIVDEANSRAIVMRLLGGAAVNYHCPSASHQALARYYTDLDFFGTAKQGQLIARLFEDLGYAPDQRFNAIQGKTRLIFKRTSDQRRVDIFLDVFRMCHRLYIGKRLTLDEYTIPITDLLLTKLQIVQINEKDVRDIIAILHDHEVVASPQGDTEEIDGNYAASLCANDWGLCRTITFTLKQIRLFMSQHDLTSAEKMTLETRIARLLKFVDETPKSLKWRMRALVGEKVRWYELPEAESESNKTTSV